jgi:hypothetical protein
MEKHCVSLEIAKQLKEAGWQKETEFWWIPVYYYDFDIENRNRKDFEIVPNSFQYSDDVEGRGRSEIDKSKKSPYNKWQQRLPAPIATEILEEFNSWQEKGIYIFNDCDTYFVQFREVGFGKLIKDCNNQYLPNALALMWLYLKKEKLI